MMRCVLINQKEELTFILNVIEEVLNEINSKCPESNILIGGDFYSGNADKGDVDWDPLPYVSPFANKRESEDVIINNREGNPIELLEKNELFNINIRFPDDIPEQFTFINT